MTLRDIKLTDVQQEELKNKLDAWKAAEKKKIEEELTERYEQMEAEVKEESENLIEEVKSNMQKVYSKRFTKALREMYREIKAEVMVESMQGPEAKALEEVKAVVYPLINESTTKRHADEFKKLASMYNDLLESHEMMKGNLKKAQLLESLSEGTRNVVSKMIGEGTQEQVVEKFAVIKKALKEEASQDYKQSVVEDYSSFNTDDDYEEEADLSSRIEEDNYEEKEVIVEEKSGKRKAFETALHEQLALAGLRKIK